jgi:hypothetical protein
MKRPPQQLDAVRRIANRRVALRLLAGLAFLLGVAILCAELFAPTVSIKINSVDAQLDEGFAYIVPLQRQRGFFYRFRSDWIDRTKASALILYENGRQLGPAHSSHEEIRRQGAGRFSHWGTAIWLSSSDGTDPRTNGRAYAAQVKLSVRPVWRLTGIILFGTALLVISFGAASRINGGQWRSRVDTLSSVVRSLSRPRQQTSSLTTLFGAFGLVICTGAVIYGWYDGDTSITGLGVARYLPVSDAFGYHSCATSIAAAGKFDEPFGSTWCARRTLYPAMLASLLSFTGWSSQTALIIQGALVGVAIAAFALSVASVAGAAAAVLAAALLFFYAWEFVLGLFMTEVAGFTLGLCGLALLLGFCKTKYWWFLLVGSVFVSIGLAARAGALLVLAALPLWALLAFKTSVNAERARFFVLALLGVLTGPLLHFAILSLLGADATNTGGNFSASLYGLSTGSRDWSQAYRDFEPLFNLGESQAFQHIYWSAWENITNNPAVFINSLLEAGRWYLVSLFSFINAEGFNASFTALAVLGAVRCFLNIRRPSASLVITLAVAEVLTAPLIIDSGGTRVFAVTAAVRFLLCGIGAQWVLQCLYRAMTSNAAPVEDESDATSPLLLATGTGVLVLALIIAPATPLAYMGRLQAVAGLGCPIGLKEVVAQFGNESQSMAIIETNTTVESFDPFQISMQRLINDSRITATWFGKDFLRLSPPLSIVRAVDLSSATISAVKPLIFLGLLPDGGGVQSLCVDEDKYVELAGVRHHLIKEIRPIGQPGRPL